MDGFGRFDALDHEAASGLLTLQEIDANNTSAPLVSRTASNVSTASETDHAKEGDVPHDGEDVPTPDTTPPNSQPSSQQTTPVREFKLAGMKREREDLYTIFYASGADKIGVPFTKGIDSAATLFMRRDAAVRHLFSINRDVNRGNAYCSWRSTMISLVVQDSKWTQFRESMQQRRYNHKAIQLVITRYTCTQWRETAQPCRNCSNRNWRTACLKPTFLMHVMPLPVYRHQTELCEECLADFHPACLEQNTTAWTQRMPQINVR